MNNKEKIAIIEEILDAEEGVLEEELQLDTLDEWDSITKLSLIIWLDENTGKTYSGEDMKKIKTVKDIMDIMD